ncbi:copper-binding protein [soil metagenome]
MKINVLMILSLAAVTTACGPRPQSTAPAEAAKAPQITAPTGPEYDSTGVIGAIEGQTLTLDHEGASAAKLAAGRTPFTAYADILAEAPLRPGARVGFKFRKVGAGYELTELKGR